MSNRYEIEITARPLSGDEQDGLARVGLIPGEYAAFARIGNMLEWATTTERPTQRPRLKKGAAAGAQIADQVGRAVQAAARAKDRRPPGHPLRTAAREQRLARIPKPRLGGIPLDELASHGEDDVRSLP